MVSVVMPVINPPDNGCSVVHEQLRRTVANLEGRIIKLENQIIVGEDSKGSYDYDGDRRPPSEGQLKLFRRFYRNVHNLPEFPPKDMPRGHIWLTLKLHFNPELESTVKPEIISSIRSVIGDVEW